MTEQGSCVCRRSSAHSRLTGWWLQVGQLSQGTFRPSRRTSFNSSTGPNKELPSPGERAGPCRGVPSHLATQGLGRSCSSGDSSRETPWWDVPCPHSLLPAQQQPSAASLTLGALHTAQPSLSLPTNLFQFIKLTNRG